jgi:Glycosyltransferases involved in cell wall biogenesis
MNQSHEFLTGVKIGVVIPAYRVENQIKAVVASIPEWVTAIIIVNDCSPDRTRQIVESLADPRVHLVNHSKNAGVGGAMLSGYQLALELGMEVIAKIDGDGQMDTAYLPLLLEPIIRGNADYTKGNRFLHPTELKKMPPIRFLGNLALTFLTKMASGYWNIFDPTNGYTAISADKLQALDPNSISHNYFFESSMLCELRQLNAVVEDVPIPAIYKDEKSSVNIPREFFIFFGNLIARSSKRILNRYFLFDFTAVSADLIFGALLLIFGFIWGIIKWAHSIQTNIPATTGTVLIAVLPIILGFQLLIQAIALDISDVPAKVRKLNTLTINNKWSNFHL